MDNTSTSKPDLIVVAFSVNPLKGSEPGKGWWWLRALDPFFRLHVITQKKHTQRLLEQTDYPCVKEWDIRSAKQSVSSWKTPIGYIEYGGFLKEALDIARTIIAETPVVGLCHITLGSFRVLPQYNQLGIPYVLGPFGGGEYAPLSMIWTRRAPLGHKLGETLRPVFNNLFACIPTLRSCMKSAQLVLATSEESRRVIERMGAPKSLAIFPDAFDKAVDTKAVLAQKSLLRSDVGKTIRLLWQGRPLWWKCPDLALAILHRALERGVRLEVTMVGTWDNPMGASLRALAKRLKITSHLHFLGGMPRDVYLKMANTQHGFFATSLHDSGGIPLIEAQALGLPCFTLGFGGNSQAACPEAGVSRGGTTAGAFVEKAVDRLVAWQNDPDVWLEESRKAINYASQFTIEKLQAYVRDLIVPAFSEAPSKAKSH